MPLRKDIRCWVAKFLPTLAKKLFIKFALSASFVNVSLLLFRGPILCVSVSPLNFLTVFQNDLIESEERK